MKENVLLTKLYFPLESPYDSIIEINGISITPQVFGTLATQWPNIFWEELGFDGVPAHCSSAVVGEPFVLTVDKGSGNTYTVQGTPFIAIPNTGTSNIFGPNPGVFFKPGK